MSTVQQVARELGMTSQEVIARLKSMGQPADSHLTPVEDAVAQRLRREAGPSLDDEAASPLAEGNGSRTAPPPSKPAEGTPAEDNQASGEETKTQATESAPVTKDETAKDETAKGKATTKARRSSVLKQVAELPLLILLAFAIAVVIKIFLVQAFFIPSASMNPTLVRGDRVLVEKIGYRFGDPGRGHVIVFAQETAMKPPDLPWSEDVRNFFRELLGLPTGDETDFIKRIVGVGGDVIRYQGDSRKLVVNGERVDETYLRGKDTGSTKITPSNCRAMKLERRDNGCRIPAGTVFVMGDNRANSMDSRVFGPIQEDEIVGRAWLIIWPPKDFGTL